MLLVEVVQEVVEVQFRAEAAIAQRLPQKAVAVLFLWEEKPKSSEQLIQGRKEAASGLVFDEVVAVVEVRKPFSAGVIHAVDEKSATSHPENVAF